MIENNKINIFLDSWIDGIIRIGKVYLQNGNYKKSAENLLKLTTHLILNQYYLSPLLQKRLFLEILKIKLYHIL